MGLATSRLMHDHGLVAKSLCPDLRVTVIIDTRRCSVRL